MPKKERPVITFVWGDDWNGVYVDDELFMEDHQLDAEDLLKKLAEEGHFELSIEDGWTVDTKWLHRLGRLPKQLYDVKKPRDFTYTTNGEWLGLFVDGKLIFNAYQISLEDAVKEIKLHDTAYGYITPEFFRQV